MILCEGETASAPKEGRDRLISGQDRAALQFP